ncbi:MAG: signal peptidase II [Sphingomonadaceae bacterium]|nr:signal peptidase II [Sphingomonadaceae bacterium]
MNPLMRRRIIGLLIAFAIFGVDQWVKWLVVGPLQLREKAVIELLPFFDLRWTQNFGVSMGMFTATSVEMRWILVAVTGLIALVVTIWMLREKAFGDIVALAMILGGALGNIKDRYELGYVIDYADLHFGEFRPFLIFNIADAAITIGVLIILARSFLLREKNGANTQEQAGEAAAES